MIVILRIIKIYLQSIIKLVDIYSGFVFVHLTAYPGGIREGVLWLCEYHLVPLNAQIGHSVI